MKTGKPDAIVCDYQLPVTYGFEFLNSLRATGNNVAFIVFSLTDDKETALKAFKLGANGFFGKYGDPKVVFSTLQRCIEKSVKSD